MPTPIRQRTRFLFSTIFGRMVISMMILIIPLFIFLYVLFSWSRTTMVAQNVAAAEARSAAFFRDLSAEIARVSTLQYNMMSDQALVELATDHRRMDEYTLITSQLTVINRLRYIRNSSRYVANVRCYLPELSRILGIATTMDYMTGEELFNRKPFSMSNQELVIEDNQLKLVLSRYNGTGPSARMEYALVIEFDRYAIQQDLALISPLQDKRAILFSDDGSFRIDYRNASALLDEQALSGQTPWPQQINEGKTVYMVSQTSDSELGMTVVSLVSQRELLRDVDRYQQFFVLFVALSLLLVVLFAMVSYRIAYRPIIILKNAFAVLSKGQMMQLIRESRSDEFGELYQSFNQMNERLDTLVTQVYRQKIKAQRAELKHLQSQIKPHFLYNSFYLLENLTRMGNSEMAANLARELAHYYEFITHSSADDVTLREETDFAKAYCSILAARWEGRMTVTFGDVPPDWADQRVPRLILQPMIENAFDHGFRNMPGDWILNIHFRQEDHDWLVMVVEDNGSGFVRNGHLAVDLATLANEEDQDCKNTAIRNTHRRLVLQFGPQAGLSFRQSVLGGLCVELKIRRME